MHARSPTRRTPHARTPGAALQWVGVCAVLAVGCAPDPVRVPVAPTHGHVTVDGQPIEHGYVIFIPNGDRGNTGPPARSAITPGTKGGFVLSTYDDYDGAAIGWHRVCVHMFDSPDEDSPELLPPRFNLATRLSAYVAPGKENLLTFRLETTPPASQPH